MNWEELKMWVTNPIATYRDNKKIRQIELARIEQNLKNTNDEQVTRGFNVMSAKDIKAKAQKIYKRDEQLRPSADLVQMVRDLRAGQKMRQAREAQYQRDELKRNNDGRGYR